MNMNNRTKVFASTVGAIAILTLSAVPVLAHQQNTTGTKDPAKSESRRSERQSKMQSRLADAVASGKITTQQKDQSLAKIAELKPANGSMKGMSPAERKEAKKSIRSQISQWAKDNGLDIGLFSNKTKAPK